MSERTMHGNIGGAVCLGVGLLAWSFAAYLVSVALFVVISRLAGAKI